MPARAAVGFLGLVSAAVLAGAAARGQDPSGGRLPHNDRDAPPAFGTVRISELMPLPNLAVGIAGGEYVEIYNAAAGSAVPADIGGWQLQTDSGASYLIPDGTSLAAGQYLVVDFSQGSVASTLLPEYESQVLVASGFQNSFFHNPGAIESPYFDGFADMLALLDRNGRIRDCILYAQGYPLPDGSLVEQAVREKEWHAGDYVPTGGLDPHESDIGFCRYEVDAADTNDWRAWLYGLAWVGPTAGTDHNWKNLWDASSQSWVRSYVENVVTGRISHSPEPGTPYGFPVAGATITLTGPGLGIPLTGSAGFDGLYEVRSVPPGVYQVHVVAPGFVSTWRIIEQKSPHAAYHLDVSLVPEDSTSTVTATVLPGGTVIEGPRVATSAGLRPLFKIEFPPDAVTEPVQVKASFIAPERHPVVLGSMVLQEAEGWHTCWESLGAVSMTPHLTFGTIRPTVSILYREPSLGSTAGELLLAETIQGAGAAERLPDGELVEADGVLWAEAVVTHFSFLQEWKMLRTVDGQVIAYQDKGDTTDKNGDGDVDFVDSPPWCFGFCPGDSVTITVGYSAETSTTQGSSWQASGSLSGETGAILNLFARGKITAGASYGEADSTTNSTDRTTSISHTMTYDLEARQPPDKEESCLWVMWKIIWIKKSFCPEGNTIHVHRGSESTYNRNDLPDEILAIPVGFDRTNKVTGHCGAGGS